MALKEYIEIKRTIPKVRKKPFKVFMLHLIAVVINNIIPFACGFYFVQTKNIFFIMPMFFVIFFNIVVRTDKDV
jgi:hypothetical protein